MNSKQAVPCTRSYCLPTGFLFAALLSVFGAAQAAGPPAPSASEAPARSTQHPLVGSWTWRLPGKSCAETYQFRPDGTRTGSSGEEVTQGNYEVSPVPSLLGFYRLVETLSESNGKKDCSGDLHEASADGATRYIQLSPKRDQFIICKAESLKACFGPLKRMPG